MLQESVPPQGGPLAVLEARRGDYVRTSKRAAAILSVCTRTVWRLIESGKLNAISISERRRGILASELARYMGRPQ